MHLDMQPDTHPKKKGLLFTVNNLCKKNNTMQMMMRSQTNPRDPLKKILFTPYHSTFRYAT
jgi:hypothetical protein